MIIMILVCFAEAEFDESGRLFELQVMSICHRRSDQNRVQEQVRKGGPHSQQALFGKSGRPASDSTADEIAPSFSPSPWLLINSTRNSTIWESLHSLYS